MKSLLILICSALVCLGQSFGPGPAIVGNWNPRAAAGGGGGGAPASSLGVTTNASSGGAINTFVTNVITIPSGDANRLIIVTVSVGDGTWERPQINVSGVGLASTSITNNILWETNDANWAGNSAYYYKAPPVGSFTNIYLPTAPKDQCVIDVRLWTNCNQTATFGTAAATKGTGTAPSVTVSSVAGTATVYCSISTDAEGSLTVNNGTQLWKIQNVSSDTDHGGSSLAGGTSVTPSWTTGSQGFAIGAVSINAP
jgi:hypothetical protein